MEEIEIKEVSIREQYEVISEFMRGLHESERGYFDKTAPWPEIANNYMKHVMSMQEEAEGTCLIAYNNGRPVGFIFAYVEEQNDSRIEIYTGKELYVSDGYVHPNFRGKGIYRKMNTMLENKYIPQGVKRITRFTLVNNEPMKSFLNAEGYKPTRILFERWL